MNARPPGGDAAPPDPRRRRPRGRRPPRPAAVATAPSPPASPTPRAPPQPGTAPAEAPGAAPSPRLLWAPQAWVDGRWRDAVLLAVDDAGDWSRVDCDTPPPPAALRLPGAVLPGVVDAHSHAFQRAFVGLAERRDGAHDDFWSWRDGMYRVASRIGAAGLRAVAAQLYRELLAGGYTQVCEFHYLHHRADGGRHPDDDPDAPGGEAALARALADAAVDAGIGLTLLPVLYERAGFEHAGLRDDQRRFAADTATVLRLRDAVRGWRLPGVTAGVAVHSLRAAHPASIRALARAVADDDAPVHLHVAEQTAEVDACLRATGRRPIEWLLHEPGLLDARWQLVHATHATPAEIDGVAARGAGVVLCPGTEADLGDGVPDLPRWLAAGVPLAVGSDSQVTRGWPDELRLLEFAQRLQLRRRNVGAAPPTEPSTAARLLGAVLAGGAAAAGGAAGRGDGGLRVGARADLLVLAGDDAVLAGVPADRRLDALVFGAPAAPFAQVWVAGRCRHRGAAPPAAPAFLAALAALRDEDDATTAPRPRTPH